MSDVRWIKIVTDIFDDEKMLLIDGMPKADSLMVIWFKLLCLAGKQNNCGVLQMGSTPYTDKMFATVFRRPITTVRAALEVFEQLGMIEIVNDTVTIPNWGKHQTLDAYERKKENDRIRQEKKREEQRAAVAKKSQFSRVTSRDGFATVTRQDKEGDKDIDIDIYKEREKEREKPHSRYGKFNNVVLTDEEYRSLSEEYSSVFALYIERLSCYMAEKNKRYANPYATIVKWINEDKARKKLDENFSNSSQSYSIDDIEKTIRKKAVTVSEKS